MYSWINNDYYNFGTKHALIPMAIDAYTYGYPLVLMDITRRLELASISQINRFYNQRVLSTPRFTQVVRPNVDTLYSSAWLDLRQGPILLNVPNTDNRYYVLPMLDAWSNVFASVGARTTGTSEQTFAIIGPDCQVTLPPTVARIYSPTNTVWITGRTQTNGPNDYPMVHAIQDNYTLTLLNGPHYIPDIDNLLQEPIITSQESPKDQIATMDAPTFFTTMITTMYRNPPYASIQSREINITLMMLGLIPSADFNFYRLSPSVQRALIYAVKNGQKVIRDASNTIFKNNEYNVWSMLLKDIGSYGTNYVERAVVAMTLFGANIPQDSVYAYNFVDNSGEPLQGNNNYVIHFNYGELPPVNAFWSLTLYNNEGFLIENSIKRYAVSPHLERLNYNTDGSLDIFIQNTTPGKDLESNWLPTPDTGKFNLMLRMYWPVNSILNGEWNPPTVLRR